jgi:hypothetical protein
MLEITKRDKIRQIVLGDMGGYCGFSESIFEKIVDMICDKLESVDDDYNSLLSAYINL